MQDTDDRVEREESRLRRLGWMLLVAALLLGSSLAYGWAVLVGPELHS